MEEEARAGLTAVAEFRRLLHGCFGRRRDALFEVVEGLLAAGTRGSTASVAQLSLAARHRRKWGSAYAALRRGEVDADALRVLLTQALVPGDGGPHDFAVDVSAWPRRYAATSPERGYWYHPSANRGPRHKPVTEAWAYQWVARLGVLGRARSSWTAPIDVRRVRPDEKPGTAALAQIRALAAALAAPALRASAPAADAPLFAFDAGYDASYLSVALAALPVAFLVRLRSNRIFFMAPARQPPLAPGAAPRGLRPKRLDAAGATPAARVPPGAAAKFVCTDPATWPPPTATLRRTDPDYGHVEVRAWAGLHSIVRRPRRPGPEGRGRWHALRGPFRGPRETAVGVVLRVQLQRLPSAARRVARADRRAPYTPRMPDTLWLWWQGPHGRATAADVTPAVLDRCWRAYVRRYDLEQTFRFLKQRLAWTTPRVRLPDQGDRWTWLVAAAFAQLLLARTAVADHRLPWERPLPPDRLTPTRVLRAFVALAHRLPRVAATPRPCGRSPGRPKGRRSRPAPRYPPITKAN